MMKSVAKFGKVPQMKCASISVQVPGSDGFHAFERGLHWKMITRILIGAKRDVMPIKAQQVKREKRSVNTCK